MDCNMLPTTNDAHCSSTPRTNFSNLSLDIILAIADHLLVSSVVCLLLTCKHLYHSQQLRIISNNNWNPFAHLEICPNPGHDCYPGIIDRNHDYLDLVRTLRKDLPLHLLCEFCQKFHPKPTPKVLRQRSDWLYCSAAPKAAMWLDWPSYCVHLQFEDVQMVMNRHRWGGSHGAPLSSISIDENWEVGKRSTQTRLFLGKFSLDPEIVDGNLLIHTMERIFFAARELQGGLSNIKPLYEWIKVFSSCRHSSAIQHLTKRIDDLLSSCIERVPTRSAFMINCGAREIWKKSELSQCPDCSTCSCVEIACHNGRSELRESGYKGHGKPVHGVELIVHSWMHLGECEHTFSPSWLRLCYSTGELYPIQMHKEAMNLDEVFRNERLQEARIRYDRITLCSSTLKRPSLIASVKYAVAQYPYETKYHEVSKILRGSNVITYDICKQILVEDDLGCPIEGDHRISQAEFNNLSRAREFIREYNRKATPEPEPRCRLWTRLCSKLYEKLSFRWRADKRLVNSTVEVHVTWP